MAKSETEEIDRSDESSDDDDERVETSLEEFLSKRKERGKKAASGDEEDEDALLEAMDERDSRASESLTVKVVPPQEDEFTCRGCFLVKHSSQLKNRKRLLCVDCA